MLWAPTLPRHQAGLGTPPRALPALPGSGETHVPRSSVPCLAPGTGDAQGSCLPHSCPWKEETPTATSRSSPKLTSARGQEPDGTGRSKFSAAGSEQTGSALPAPNRPSSHGAARINNSFHVRQLLDGARGVRRANGMCCTCSHCLGELHPGGMGGARSRSHRCPEPKIEDPSLAPPPLSASSDTAHAALAHL